MACRDEAREGSRKRRVREFVASWFVERCLSKDEQQEVDLGKRLASEFMMPRKDKAKLVAVDGEFSSADDKIQMDKAKLVAVDGEFSAADDKIQMDKAKHEAVEVLDGDKNGYETEKMDKTEAPMDDIEYLAKLLNRSDDWIQERRQLEKENAARSKRIMEDFVKFHVNDQGCLVDEYEDDDEEEEDDDEYDARYARLEAFSAELWSQHNDFSRLENHYIPEEEEEEGNTMAALA